MKKQQKSEDALYCPPMILNRRTGLETRLFEIDATVCANLHYHETLEIGLCLEGEGTLYAESGTYPYHAGDVQIVFPFLKHISATAPGTSSRWYFTALQIPDLLNALSIALPDELSDILATGNLCGIFTPAQQPGLVACVETIIRESLTPKQDHRTICALSAMELLYYTKRLSQPGTTTWSAQRSRNDAFLKIQPALSHLSEHINVQVSSQNLAALCYMSETNFRILFKRITGLSPKKYISRNILSLCEHYLLTTDLGIEEISELFGFRDVSGLYRLFVQYHAVSPTAYRSKYQAVQNSISS